MKNVIISCSYCANSCLAFICYFCMDCKVDAEIRNRLLGTSNTRVAARHRVIAGFREPDCEISAQHLQYHAK